MERAQSILTIITQSDSLFDKPIIVLTTQQPSTDLERGARGVFIVVTFTIHFLNFRKRLQMILRNIREFQNSREEFQDNISKLFNTKTSVKESRKNSIRFNHKRVTIKIHNQSIMLHSECHHRRSESLVSSSTR